jgi:cellulose synthase/poly-beta-1,6-N-acetylglucosamine synthase-like glycosyltransferase
MIWVLLIVSGIVILQDILLVTLFSPSPEVPAPANLPYVSVLVAARNEEKNIESCLNALLAQEYDFSQLEILVGDDQSTDQTAEIVQHKAGAHHAVTYFLVPASETHVSGKAHVLGFLAGKAKGEIFLITDADMRPNRSWITTLVSEIIFSKSAMINGVTDIPLHRAQDMEWIYAQGFLKVVSDFFRPVTCIGNNMAITREAYEATGGYENIPFSLTEDQALFNAAHKKGYALKQLFSASARSATEPMKGLNAYLQQRKRWMTGVVQLPAAILVLLGMQSLFLLCVLCLLYYEPLLALVVFLFRILFRMLGFLRLFHALGRPVNLLHLFWFEVYSGALNILVLFYYLLPGKVRWKNRSYKKTMK